MLNDRNYMRNPLNRHRETQLSGIKCVFALIVINVLVFIFVHDSTGRLFNEMALSYDGIMHLKYWQPLTSMFMHASWGHLFGNMFGLYIFGTVLAPELGAKKFLILYFLSGFAGDIAFAAINWGTPYTLIGASGAVFGVVMATAMVFPNKELMLLLFPFFTFKFKTFATVYICFEVFSEMALPGNIAHMAHLGGVLAAYIYMKKTYRGKLWDILGFMTPKSSTATRRTKQKVPDGWSVKNPTAYDNKQSFSNQKVSRYELDVILDKISDSGINSLTQEETDALKRAREQMKSS